MLAVSTRAIGVRSRTLSGWRSAMIKSLNRSGKQRLSPTVRPDQGHRLTRRGLLGGAAASGVLVGIGGSLTHSAPAAAARQDGAIGIYTSAVDIPNIDPGIGHDGAIAITQKHVYDTLYRHV